MPNQYKNNFPMQPKHKNLFNKDIKNYGSGTE